MGETKSTHGENKIFMKKVGKPLWEKTTWGTDQWQALVNTVMNLGFSQKPENFLT